MTSVVVCLEDAIADEQVAAAERNLVDAFCAPARRRRPASCRCCSSGSASPRRSPRSSGGSGRPRTCSPGSCCRSSPRAAAPSTCSRSRRPSAEAGGRCWRCRCSSPARVLYAETRVDELTRLRALLRPRPAAHPRRPHRRHRPVRGSTACAAHRDLTIYDVRVVAEADRRRRQRPRPRRRHRVHRDRAGVGVLLGHERMFKPQLRQSPFARARRPAPARRAVSPSASTG